MKHVLYLAEADVADDDCQQMDEEEVQKVVEERDLADDERGAQKCWCVLIES